MTNERPEDGPLPSDSLGSESVLWIRLPEGFSRTIGSFELDPAIPIPVENAAGVPRDASALSIEAILAGMLKVLAWSPEDANAAYYRSFILAARPGIAAELASAGLSQAAAGALDIAREIFLALAGLEPENAVHQGNLAALHDDRAAALERAGKEEEAEAEGLLAVEAWKKALAMPEPSPEISWGAAHSAIKRRDWERARSLLAFYAKTGEDEDKRVRAEEIIRKIDNQGYLDSVFKEAYDFIRMGKEEEGLERIEAFLKSYGGVWNAWFLKGWALRRLARWEEGRAAFERALALITEPEDRVDPLNELAICLLELERLPEARRRLEEALGIEPENVKIISNLGMLSLRLGKREEARGFFMAALEIEPGDPLAAECLAKLEQE